MRLLNREGLMHQSLGYLFLFNCFSSGVSALIFREFFPGRYSSYAQKCSARQNNTGKLLLLVFVVRF